MDIVLIAIIVWITIVIIGIFIMIASSIYCHIMNNKREFSNKKNPYYQQINELYEEKETLIAKETSIRATIKNLREEAAILSPKNDCDIKYQIAILEKERLETVKEINKIYDKYSQMRELYNKSENAHT